MSCNIGFILLAMLDRNMNDEGSLSHDLHLFVI